MDIFNNDAFSVVRLTDAINNIQYVPTRIQELGLFQTENVDTTTIVVEKNNDVLALVAPTPRGGPGVTVASARRDVRSLLVPHFEINDAVYAESVQNVRAFGQMSQLETVIGKIASKQKVHVNSMAATEEYARAGALKGIITYADGSTLNLFTEFNVAENDEIDFALTTDGSATGALRKKCAGVSRGIQNKLGAVPFSGIHAFCDDEFFDALLGNQEVRELYKGWSEAQILADSYVGINKSSYGQISFGGIVFENYRGGVGNTAFIATNKVQVFPLGVDGLFKTAYAPADYNETVNTVGQRLYSRQWDMGNGKGRYLDVQMNALQYCTRPNVLFKGKKA
jgi:hypothetical protein